MRAVGRLEPVAVGAGLIFALCNLALDRSETAIGQCAGVLFVSG